MSMCVFLHGTDWKAIWFTDHKHQNVPSSTIEFPFWVTALMRGSWPAISACKAWCFFRRFWTPIRSLPKTKQSRWDRHLRYSQWKFKKIAIRHTFLSQVALKYWENLQDNMNCSLEADVGRGNHTFVLQMPSNEMNHLICKSGFRIWWLCPI